MLFYCWFTVYDAGPALNQHWSNISCSLGSFLMDLTFLHTQRSVPVPQGTVRYACSQTKVDQLFLSKLHPVNKLHIFLPLFKMPVILYEPPVVQFPIGPIHCDPLHTMYHTSVFVPLHRIVRSFPLLSKIPFAGVSKFAQPSTEDHRHD